MYRGMGSDDEVGECVPSALVDDNIDPALLGVRL